jgi:hypothetical protein
MIRSKNIFKILLGLLLFVVAYVIAGSVDSIHEFLPYCIAAAPILVSMDYPEAECRLGGVGTEVYVCRKSDVETFPDFKAAPTTPSEYTELDGNIVLTAGKYFIKIESEQEQNELKITSTGNKGNVFFKQEGSAFTPSVNNTALGMAALMNNAQLIVAFRDSADDSIIILGNMNQPASCKAEIGYGKKYDDTKGVTFSFEFSGCRVQKYSGIIALGASEYES